MSEYNKYDEHGNLKPPKTMGNMFLPLHGKMNEIDVIYIVENLTQILNDENMLDRGRSL